MPPHPAPGDGPAPAATRALPATLALPASLDIGAAEALLHALRQGLRAGPMVLDGSGVERVSVPCLQVLAAAMRPAGEEAPPLRIVRASAALSGAIADLGLAAALPLES